jgi:CheY-like chemotaxis protein
MELRNGDYDVYALVNDVSRLSREHRGEKEVEFTIRIDENIPATLHGDASFIKQILDGFLAGAFEFTSKGTVSLSMYAIAAESGVTAESGEPGAVNLLITIRNTGRGMGKEQESALRGMTVVFEMLKIMNAVFEIDSRPERGTTLSVLIPQKAVGKKLLGKENAHSLRKLNESIRVDAALSAVTPEPMPDGKVLIVDDVPANIHVVRGLLRLYDLQVDACISGRECIARINKGREYDIIFMDHHMPGYNGMETTRRLREIGYKKPIVALTANTRVKYTDGFVKSGFDGFLSKPVSAVRLSEVLHRFIPKDAPPP